MKVLKQSLFSIIGQCLLVLLAAYIIFQVGMQSGANHQVLQANFHREQEITPVLRTILGFPWILKCIPSLAPVQPPPVAAPVTPQVELSEPTMQRIVEIVAARLSAPQAALPNSSQASVLEDDERITLPDHLLPLLSPQNRN